MQITIASADNGFGVGVSNPWSEYVKLLSDQMSVPTMWTEQERELLRGTSLEVCRHFSLFLLVFTSGLRLLSSFLHY